MIDGAWDWRDDDAAAVLRRAESAVLAQEFLRCNPIYASSRQQLMRVLPSAGASREAELAGFAWPWGLSFPVRSCP
ncbi:hypothetical protein AA103196_0631 [Ameyamaea chiangmaiensis NBRC 103196]|uniref:Transcriptional regulator-like domain-containing protein n=1 Tax=Ameyamaea chiangmaiensis TaxID=442969 RepID=A0A850PBH4_9PROT|nr:DUF6499 domain-containing protein [Ameyamaea chiangmaiensis]MBS4076625.1 hypothetical protein [Ameyamaea chiangmaiensis]NVN39880.1 hypothetical protein [Ameyamaea chiangmaiensis]GBQ63564.1 hypothetical protein AA103196_0631 [Ameyamaea chiangmaiensis NBRC 103196]